MTARRPRAGQNASASRITDVARLAEVSIATVSRALASPGTVAPETRERVMQAVRECGYTPNVAARALRARRAMMVLVVVPNISSPFFAVLLRGIDQELSRSGHGLIIGDLDDGTARDGRFVDIASSGAVDGVLLLSTGRVPGGNGRDLLASGRPIVAISEQIEGARFPQVVVENRRAAREVVRHLAALGHRRIAYVTGDEAFFTAQERREGFLQGLLEAGLSPAEAIVWKGDFTLPTGVAAAGRFLALAVAARPSAVFAASDAMAIGFIKTVREAGVRVPRDVSVVGFDDIEFAIFCDPSLTTVAQPRREMGRISAALLVRQLQGETIPDHSLIRLPAPLVVRASTAEPPHYLA